MGNESAQMYCPVHEKQKIKFLCSLKQCIEPLCDKCLENHREKHQKLGISPKFIQISKLVKQNQTFQKSNKINMKKQQKIGIQEGEFVSTGNLLKYLTNQYFLQRNKRGRIRNNSKETIQFKKNNSISAQRINFKNSRSFSSSSQISNSSNPQAKQQKKKNKMVKIISQYELYKKMESNTNIKKRVVDFFKKNLVLNEGVVGKQFSYLYE